MHTAVFSPCRTYRYQLIRELAGTQSPLVFCMLNPSTADENVNDRTINRCITFATREQASQLVVVNLYGFRTSYPKDLWETEDPIGPENDTWIVEGVRAAGRVICAWGTNAQPARVEAVMEMLAGQGCQLLCLARNKDGSPKHPLYVRATQLFIPFAS